MLIRVRCPEGTVHLSVREHAGGPAWARVGGHAIDHVERAHACGERLREAARRLDRATAPVVLALRDAFVDCALEVLPTLPPEVSPPRWPLRIRTGGPGSPWPFDPELAALSLGLRRALKREAFDEREAAADAAWLERHGLVVRRVGGVDRDGRRTLLAARQHGELDALAGLELAAQQGEAAAVSELGARLGYPSCCVDAFAALGRRDDALVLPRALRDPREGALAPELLVLSAALALVSHVPCEPTCPRTLAQARAVLAALEGERPVFALAWRELAARVHVIDIEGRCLALAATDVDAGLAVHDAVELVVADDPRRARPDLVGRTLAWRGRALVGAGIEGVLVADHRAPT